MMTHSPALLILVDDCSAVCALVPFGCISQSRRGPIVDMVRHLQAELVLELKLGW